MKRRIKLTESDLHMIIRESVKKVLKEYDEGSWQYHSDMATNNYNKGDFKTGNEHFQRSNDAFKKKHGIDMQRASAELTGNGQWSPAAKEYDAYMKNRKFSPEFKSNG